MARESKLPNPIRYFDSSPEMIRLLAMHFKGAL